MHTCLLMLAWRGGPIFLSQIRRLTCSCLPYFLWRTLNNFHSVQITCVVFCFGFLQFFRRSRESSQDRRISSRVKTHLSPFSSMLYYQSVGFISPWPSFMANWLTVAVSLPWFSEHVVVLSAVILVLLFLVQRFGTSRVSFTFSPIMLLWFASIAGIGVYNIVMHYPPVLKAVSPHYIYYYFAKNKRVGWEQLGAVILCITGEDFC